jgi:hypothetical protein
VYLDLRWRVGEQKVGRNCSDDHHNFHPSPNFVRGSKIKEGEMGETFSTPKEKRCLEKLGIDWG